MAAYRPPRRETIQEHLVIARGRVKMSENAWSGVTESFVRSLIKAGLLPRMTSHTKALGRGRAARMTPAGYRDLLRIVRLRALGVPRREWAFFLWLRGTAFPESRVRTSAVASFRRIAKTLQKEIAPTGRYGFPAQVKAQRTLNRDPDSDPVLAPFLAAAFAWMADPKSEINIDSLWDGVPEALTRLGVEPAMSEHLMGLRTGHTTADEAWAQMGTIMRDATGLDPEASFVVEGLGELVQTAQSGRMRSFFVDKHDRSRLLERLLNAPWPAYLRARAFVAATTQRVLDHLDLDIVPERERASIQAIASTQGTLAKFLLGSPWVRVLIFAIYVEDSAPNTDTPPVRFM